MSRLWKKWGPVWIIGALAALASQINWLSGHGWDQAWIRLALSPPAGALILWAAAWALAKLFPKAVETAIIWLKHRMGSLFWGLLMILGLDHAQGRRAWLAGLIVLLLAGGWFAYLQWEKPASGQAELKRFYANHTGGKGKGLSGVLYARVDMTGRPVDLGLFSAWDFKGLGQMPGSLRQNFVIRWLGSLETLQEGRYGFGGKVDDGLEIIINGRQILRTWRRSAAREVWAEVKLDKGIHTLDIRYLQLGGEASLSLRWQPPDQPRQPLDPARLRPLKPSAPLAQIARIRAAYDLFSQLGSTYPPLRGGRHWELPW
ncbi:MAG: PA14 domain-containing protein [Desulfarculaceae bacterium]|jgi:hypothetical protein